MNKIKLHVIVPTYNTSTKLFKYCITSIQYSALIARSQIDTQLYIIDDCSDQKYSKYYKKIASKCINTHYHRFNENSDGLFHTRLNALKLLKLDQEDWILWLDSDDMVDPNYILEFTRAILKYPEANFINSIFYCRLYDSNSNYIGSNIWYRNHDKIKYLRHDGMINSKFTKVKLFNHALEHYTDFNTFLKEDKLHTFLMYKDIVLGLSDGIFYYNKFNSSMSSNKTSKRLKQAEDAFNLLFSKHEEYRSLCDGDIPSNLI